MVYPLVQWSTTIISSISSLHQGKVIDCEDKTRHMPGAQCLPENSLCFWTKVNEVTQSTCYTKANSVKMQQLLYNMLYVYQGRPQASLHVCKEDWYVQKGDVAESDLMHYSLFSQPPEQPVNKLRRSVSSSFTTSLKIIFPCNQKRMKLFLISTYPYTHTYVNMTSIAFSCIGLAKIAAYLYKSPWYLRILTNSRHRKQLKIQLNQVIKRQIVQILLLYFIYI